MTTAAAIVHYLRAIRCHPRSGAYIPLEILEEIGGRPDSRDITDAVFSIINWHNDLILPRYPEPWEQDDDDEDIIEFWALD